MYKPSIISWINEYRKSVFRATALQKLNHQGA